MVVESDGDGETETETETESGTGEENQNQDQNRSFYCAGRARDDVLAGWHSVRVLAVVSGCRETTQEDAKKGDAVADSCGEESSSN